MHIFNEKFCILIKISLKFVPKSPIYNKPTSLEIMAWRRIGDKPLSEPKLTRFPEHRCGTTGGWAKVCLEVPGVEVPYQGICRCEFLLNLWYNRQWHDLLIWTAVMLWNGHPVLHMCFPSQRPLVTYLAYKYDVILMTLRLSHTLRILTCEIEMVRYVARTLQPCDNWWTHRGRVLHWISAIWPIISIRVYFHCTLWIILQWKFKIQIS